jgi:hypothetical protein
VIGVSVAPSCPSTGLLPPAEQVTRPVEEANARVQGRRGGREFGPLSGARACRASGSGSASPAPAATSAAPETSSTSVRSWAAAHDHAGDERHARTDGRGRAREHHARPHALEIGLLVMAELALLTIIPTARCRITRRARSPRSHPPSRRRASRFELNWRREQPARRSRGVGARRRRATRRMPDHV